MNLDTLFSDDITVSLVIWCLMISILFLLMVYGLLHNIRQLRTYRKLMMKRVRQLRLNKMLGRLNIPVKDYIRNTSELDKERHIRHCKACPNPDACECMLLGEDIDPNTFCPNYHELSKL